MPEHTTIACDESGAEGENLVGSASRVFAHASVALSTQDAQAALQELRERAPSQAPEFKSKQLLTPRRRDALRWLLAAEGPLYGRASVNLVDKEYFIVGKVVDLLVEELAHAEGKDLYRDYSARRMAWDLHRQGPRALSSTEWSNLLSAFNSLMRVKQRPDKTTVDAFFAEVDRVRLRSRRRRVTEVLQLVWRARPHADAFQAQLIDDPETLPALDPLVATLAQTARTWAERTGGPIKMVHDEQSMLTRARVTELVHVLKHQHPDFKHLAPPVRLLSIDLVRSQDDARVMLADLLAGVGRAIASEVIHERPNLELVAALRPYVDTWSLWSDEASWRLLSGRERPGS